jgi:hypothetical protein
MVETGSRSTATSTSFLNNLSADGATATITGQWFGPCLPGTAETLVESA